jgi:uncharacterized Rossmann fold enzyme
LIINESGAWDGDRAVFVASSAVITAHVKAAVAMGDQSR